MTEQQILKKIDVWNEDDHIQAVVDFIENLPHEEKTTAVLSELGRAYNNLYWQGQDDSPESKKYLQRAVEVFKYLEDEIGDTDKWNYRIGYSYFYLNDIENARKHLERAVEHNHEDAQYLLHYLDIAQAKGITPEQAMEGGIGGVEYILEDFLHTIEEYAPQMTTRLGAPASQEAIEGFEKRMGFTLPDYFKQLHRTFSGQTEPKPFFGIGQRFVSLTDIEKYQQELLSFVREHYGENWQEIHIPEEDFNEEGYIKNQLFNPKWVPFMIREIEGEPNSYLCFDFDNDSEGFYGQLIAITPDKELGMYEISFIYRGLYAWLSSTIEVMQRGLMAYSEETDTIISLNKGGFEPSYYSQEEREALEEYIEKNIGKFDDVFHELESPDIHCDVYIVKPTPERNYYTLVTGGMGAYAMNVPEGFNGSPFAELTINLPPTWNVKSDEEKDYWPIRWLKILSRLPIEQNTFLAWGHTIPTGEPLEGTNFTCMLLIAADNKEGNDAVATLPTGKEVNFYTLVPLYEEEMLYKLDNDSGALLERFSEKDIPYPPVVNIHRENVCEGFAPVQNTHLLDHIAWAFTQEHFPGLMIFWEKVKEYNADIQNDIEGFNPFGTIFHTPKLRIMYQAWIKNRKDLYDYEFLANENLFEEQQPDENGYYDALIVAEFSSGDNTAFGALELLWIIHNTLANKELGDHIFFEGFDIEGYDEEGTPVLYINCGS